MRAKKTRNVTSHSKIAEAAPPLQGSAAGSPHDKIFNTYSGMACAMAHVTARMHQKAEVREYVRRWTVMDDEADVALMAAFRSEWKRKKTLQTKGF